MDLYEALKCGASVEQLKRDFEKELDAAAAKIETEKRKDRLSDVREDAIEAFTAYLEVVLNTNLTKKDINEIKKMFMAFEMAPLKDFMNFINNAATPKKTSKSTTVKSDNDILRIFLDTL